MAASTTTQPYESCLRSDDIILLHRQASHELNKSWVLDMEEPWSFPQRECERRVSSANSNRFHDAIGYFDPLSVTPCPKFDDDCTFRELGEPFHSRPLGFWSVGELVIVVFVVSA